MTVPQAAVDELSALYRRVDEQLAARRPRCELSGRCCDFPTSGTQLWASTLEVAHALAAAQGEVPAAPPALCPWWQGGLCHLREGRPLGCRLYFCDPDWADEMAPTYERFHDELRRLHERHGVAYVYRRFVDAAAEARVPAAGDRAPAPPSSEGEAR